MISISGKEWKEYKTPKRLIDKYSSDFYISENLSKFYGLLIHEGKYFDPVIKDIEAYLNESQRYVSGTVFVELSPFNLKLNGVESKHDLMNHNLGTYGENSSNWTADEVKGFIKISSNSSKIFKKINK